MAYAQQKWYDNESGGTAITADRLNHMEDGISNSYGSTCDLLAQNDDIQSGAANVYTQITLSAPITDYKFIYIVCSAYNNQGFICVPSLWLKTMNRSCNLVSSNLGTACTFYARYSGDSAISVMKSNDVGRISIYGIR